MELEIGMKVRIKGDVDDFTDHLDSKIGIIVDINAYDVSVECEGDSWWIWKRNILEVVEE